MNATVKRGLFNRFWQKVSIALMLTMALMIVFGALVRPGDDGQFGVSIFCAVWATVMLLTLWCMVDWPGQEWPSETWRLAALEVCMVVVIAISFGMYWLLMWGPK